MFLFKCTCTADFTVATQEKLRCAVGTHSKAQHLIVLGVHGLSLFCTSGVIFSIEGNPAQLEDDVSLGLTHSKQRCYQHKKRHF